jgi:hypothetical protein
LAGAFSLRPAVTLSKVDKLWWPSHCATKHKAIFDMLGLGSTSEGEAMTAASREIPTGLDEFQVFRLFKCALIDAIVEKLYGSVKEFDASRAKEAVELVVDRDTTAGSKFRGLLNDLWTRRPVPNLTA